MTDTWINDVIKGHAKIEAMIAETAAEAFQKHFGKPMPKGVAGLYSVKMRGGQFTLSFNATRAAAALKSGKAESMPERAKEAMEVIKAKGWDAKTARAKVAAWLKAGHVTEDEAAWVEKALDAVGRPALGDVEEKRAKLA